MASIRRRHRLPIPATGRKQALRRRAALHRHLEDAELRAPMDEGQHARAARSGRPLCVVEPGIAQRAALDVQVVQAHFTVDTASKHDRPAITQPGPATQFGGLAGQLLGRAPRCRHAPQVAQLRIAHEHQPLAIRRVARRIVEVILGNTVVQRLPLATGQIELADAPMGIAPHHAAEHQATAVRRPVETEQLGAIAPRGLAQGTTGRAGDQHLAAAVVAEPREGDLASIRRPAREAVNRAGRRSQQLPRWRVAGGLYLDRPTPLPVFVGAFIGHQRAIG
ncbi:MAG: hypothetical protein PBU97_18325 [Stenotrophomonas maltophilia]